MINNNKGEVWQLNTKKSHFSPTLNKIGLNESEINYWCGVFSNYTKKKDFEIYLNKTHDGNWNWGYVTGHYKPSKHFNSIFMGVATVTDVEAEAFKYNL